MSYPSKAKLLALRVLKEIVAKTLRELIRKITTKSFTPFRVERSVIKKKLQDFGKL